jgi:hypothetical protein
MAAGRASPLGPVTVVQPLNPEPPIFFALGTSAAGGVGSIVLIYQALVSGQAAFPFRIKGAAL